MPSFTLGAIFMCVPDWVFQSMKNHVGLMNQLEWGIVNIGYDGLKEESTKLKKKYNELRVSIGLKKTDFLLYEE